MKWDEEALKETEKYRGTFQKIEEPKTPYRPNSEVHVPPPRAMRKWSHRQKVRRR